MHVVIPPGLRNGVQHIILDLGVALTVCAPGIAHRAVRALAKQLGPAQTDTDVVPPAQAWCQSQDLFLIAAVICFREPQAESMRLELRRLVLRLEVLLAETTGIEIEEKGLSVAVHYRNVHETHHDWVRRSVAETVCRSQAFGHVFGKMVVDIRPNVEWNKGYAVRWLLERFSSQTPYPILIGDDTTDEDAFAALAGQALTIRVGEPQKTAARFWVPDVCAVRAFLASVYELRSVERRH
jgi:trehalose-phosphatase